MPDRTPTRAEERAIAVVVDAYGPNGDPRWRQRQWRLVEQIAKAIEAAVAEALAAAQEAAASEAKWAERLR